MNEKPHSPRPVGEQGPALDLLIEARPIDGPSKGLVWIKTVDHLPWLVVLLAIGLIACLAVAQFQSGTTTLRVEIFSGLLVLAIAAAICWNKVGKAKSYNNKFVFSNPEDPVGFVHIDESGIRCGTPKLQYVHYTWVYFSNYAFTSDRLKLTAGTTRIIVNLDRLSDKQRAELRAGLARVFARPRIGPALYIRHCMQCGYDLIASPGPECPECGKPFHKYNYPNARASG